MKPIHLLYLPLCFLFISCFGEDRRDEYADRIGQNEWIEETMRKNYYWYEDIPESSALNYYIADPATFFNSLLSTQDGKSGHKYSYLEDFRPKPPVEQTRSISNPKDSYGFDFQIATIKNKTNYYAVVIYVVPNSPASQAGLQRGDWILQVDDKDILKDNYSNLLSGTGAKFKMGIYDVESQTVMPTGENIQISASRAIEDNPVHYDNVYDTSKGKVGYLVYNHFTSAKDESNKNDHTYDDELRQLSLKFKSSNIKEFILDLRYNPGGLLPTANLLSTILAPESAIGKELCTIKYNDIHDPLKETINMNANLLTGGANLNLSRLYVLTSASTASASELVAYCLAPYMEVITIGEKTEGKNVGSLPYEDKRYPDIILRPIVCQLFNSEDKSEYGQGITPTHLLSMSTPENMKSFLPFGDKNELLLAKALSLIEGGGEEEGGEEEGGEEEGGEEGQQRALKTGNGISSFIYSSIDRKAMPGVILGSPQTIQ